MPQSNNHILDEEYVGKILNGIISELNDKSSVKLSDPSPDIFKEIIQSTNKSLEEYYKAGFTPSGVKVGGVLFYYFYKGFNDLHCIKLLNPEQTSPQAIRSVNFTIAYLVCISLVKFDLESKYTEKLKEKGFDNIQITLSFSTLNDIKKMIDRKHLKEYAIVLEISAYLDGKYPKIKPDDTGW